jgi:hypothetical protein
VLPLVTVADWIPSDSAVLGGKPVIRGTVVLERDLPEYRLRRGDLGAVVQVYEPEGLEVEFVTASGDRQRQAIQEFLALPTLSGSDPPQGPLPRPVI